MTDGQYRVRDRVRVITDDRVIVATPTATHAFDGGTGDLIGEVLETLREGGTVADAAAHAGAEETAVRAVIGRLIALEVVTQTPTADRTAPEYTVCGPGASAVIDPPGGSVSNASPAEVATDAPVIVTVTPGLFPTYHRRLLREPAVRATPWLPIRVTGTRIHVGPVHRTDVRGCVDCHYRRFVRCRSDPTAARTRHRRLEVDPFDCDESLAYGVTLGAMYLRRVVEWEDGEPTHPTDARAGEPVIHATTDPPTVETGRVLPLGGCSLCDEN